MALLSNTSINTLLCDVISVVLDLSKLDGIIVCLCEASLLFLCFIFVECTCCFIVFELHSEARRRHRTVRRPSF